MGFVALLAYKLWKFHSYILPPIEATGRRPRRSPLLPVIYAIVDAGVLYSVTLMTTLVCFVVLTNVLAIMLEIVSLSAANHHG